MDIEIIPAKPQQTKLLRVAAYARVSSDKDAAFRSLEAQRDYYEKYVARHKDWELVGLYSDNGISGTTINRPEFQRMMQDARDGKIDLIITKSITRFARNTVILLESIRELKSLGVDCFFEKEDMHSISPDGELLLTLLAMYAEEEARSASENQKWRIRKLYEKGKPAGGHTYGYKWQDGGFTVDPQEALVVQSIFQDFLSGKGYVAIARSLNDAGIPSPFGGDWWHISVRDILINEKYIGNIRLQMYYRENFRTKKKLKNKGELDQVYVKHSHEAIIDPETFEAVQKEIQKRNEIQKTGLPSDSHTDDKDKRLFSGLIKCSGCGCNYIRKIINTKNNERPVWICNKYQQFGAMFCKAQRIPEDILISKTAELLDKEPLTREMIEQRIQQIYVPEHNHLVYKMTSGESVDVFWKHRTRRDSWTPEMRKMARERALRQNMERRNVHGDETRD